MHREEIADGLHALSQAFRYYGKEIDDTQIGFWKHAMKKHDLGDFKRALYYHIENSRFAPRISDIKDSLAEMRETASIENRRFSVAASLQPAPTEVARSWAYVIRKWGTEASELFDDPNLTHEEIEEALELCNRQACGNLNPEAIPPACWLDQVWGCTRDEAIERTPA